MHRPVELTAKSGHQKPRSICKYPAKLSHSLLEIFRHTDYVPLEDKDDIALRLKSTSYVFDIISVITDMPLSSQWRTQLLDEVLWEKNVSALQAIIDIETTYMLLVEPLNGLLKNTSASRVVAEVRKVVLRISDAQGIKLTANAHIGIAMHLSCLIDKKLIDDTGRDEVPAASSGSQAALKDPVLRVFAKELLALGSKFQIAFDDEEVVYLKSLFEQNTF
ncbi:hypothetical protein QFJ66_15325 [Raoultella terrigena]|uniref:hypothetical protein n=1 Tax=Raoultella terrigena TaxID=577 RepID=UPI002F95EB86